MPKATGALAGLLGAGAAVAVILLLALADATGPSVIVAVENRFVDGFAASLKDLAIRIFGTNDKVALEVGAIVVVLGLGAYLGAHLATRVRGLALAYGAFALLGIWSAWRDALASTTLAVVSVLVAGIVGVVVTVALAVRWAPRSDRAVAAPLPGEATPATAGIARRRIVLEAPLLAVGLALVGGLGRGLRTTVGAARSKVIASLPTPKSTVPAPAVQPFEAEGLSPYLTPNDDFYRIDTALVVPTVDTDSWRLRITGMVDRELEFTFDELLARDLVELPVTISCVSNLVGGGLIGTAQWTGIRLAELLDEAGVQEGATQIMGRSVDGFTAGFPVEAGTDGRNSLLAVGMNGEPLPRDHGYPARLIIPGLYGYVSATKWIEEIRLTTFDDEGYWVPRGWSAQGPIKLQSRIDVPRSSDTITAGPTPVAGVAWAPTRGIERVEVRFDGGSWRPAELGRVASLDTWVQWAIEWDATAGEHEIEVRAISSDGETQTADRTPPAPDGAAGHHRVVVGVDPA